MDIIFYCLLSVFMSLCIFTNNWLEKVANKNSELKNLVKYFNGLEIRYLCTNHVVSYIKKIAEHD